MLTAGLNTFGGPLTSELNVSYEEESMTEEKKDSKSKFETKNDAWVNALSGLGTTADKSTKTTFVATGPRQAEYWEDVYHGSDLAQTVVDALPKGALRRGFSVSDEDLDRKFDQLSLQKVLQDAAIRGRYLGGAAILVELKDGKSLQEQPPFGGAEITGFRLMDRIDLRPTKTAYRTFPEHWKNHRTGEVIHKDRLVFFYGQTNLSDRVLEQNNWWGLSIFELLYEPLRNFESNESNIRALIADANQGVYTINDLKEIMESGDHDALRTRLQIIDQTRSVMRAIVLGEGETFERKPTPLTELSNLWVQSMNRLSAAAQMPVTILFGREPAGLNATGESDIRSWYDRQDSYRQEILTPAILKIAALGGEKDINVTWPSLWQPTEAESAEIESTKADAYSTYISDGVLSPRQVRKALFSERAEQFGIDEQQFEEMRADSKESSTKETFDSEQVSALMEIYTAVERGDLSKKAASKIVQTAFNITKQDSIEMFDFEDSD